MEQDRTNEIKQPDRGESFSAKEIVEARPEAPLVLQTERGVLACGTSESGRNQNQDAIAISKDGFSVIDGMGGMGKGSDGEVASRTFAEVFVTGEKKGYRPEEIQKIASEKMRQKGVEEGGACYISAKIEGDVLKLAQAGDVRLIVVNSNGEVRYSSKDESKIHENRKYVTNAVQGKNPGRTTISETAITSGDKIIAGSDGLFDNLSNEEIAVIISKMTPEQAVKRLNDAVETIQHKHRQGVVKGSLDNLSILVYEIGDKSEDLSLPDFSSCNSEEEIIELLKSIDGITTSSGEYIESRRLQDLVKMFVSGYLGEGHSYLFPREGGLRDRVVELKRIYQLKETLIEPEQERTSFMEFSGDSDFNRFKEALYKNGNVSGSLKTYTPDEIMTDIDKVINDKNTINIITNKKEIRRTVASILKNMGVEYYAY